MMVSKAAPMMRLHRVGSAGFASTGRDFFFMGSRFALALVRARTLYGTASYHKWERSATAPDAMTKPEHSDGALARRDLLTAAAVLPAMAAAISSARAQSQRESRKTVLLERLPGGVLLIGIDRAEVQNHIDIPTFYALGQAFYEFEHDEGRRAAVLHGKGRDFSQGLDLASWGLGLRGPLRPPADFLDPLGTAGSERSKPLVVAVQGH